MLERLSRSEQDLFNAIVAELNRAGGDPASNMLAVENARGMMTKMQQALNRPRPERAYVIPFNSVVTVTQLIVTPTNPTPIQFPKAGRVIGIKATVSDVTSGADASTTGVDVLARLALSITDAQGYPFISNGTSSAFMSFLALNGAPELSTAGFFPFLFRRVTNNEQWAFQVTSNDLLLPAPGTRTYKPEVVVLVEHDEVNA